jgi:hypothetical protein
LDRALALESALVGRWHPHTEQKPSLSILSAPAWQLAHPSSVFPVSGKPHSAQNRASSSFSIWQRGHGFIGRFPGVFSFLKPGGLARN